MDFLRYQGRYLAAPRPSVILLDLNLPKLHGREVLARVKANPHLQTIPAIVLTSSEAESDVASGYKLMANSYLRKPGNLDEFEQMVISLNNFWFTWVKLPQRGKTSEINQGTFLMISGEKSRATNQSARRFTQVARSAQFPRECQ
jgi:CheY-like chemotaxis protein